MQQVLVLYGIGTVCMVRNIPWSMFEGMGEHGCPHVSIGHVVGVVVVRAQIDSG